MVEREIRRILQRDKHMEEKKKTELKSKGSNCGMGWIFTAYKANMMLGTYN
jgi:hypothetical protein